MNESVEIRTDSGSLWKARTSLLSKLDIELTERCNNNCIHCSINLPADDLAAKAKELSSDEVKNILREAASLGCLTVRFTGGEPLLREDFEDIYVFSRKLGLRVLLFTNATLITPRLADLFARIPPLERIEITLYGMRKNSYEAVSRVPGSFEAANRGINLLLERDIPFIIKGVILPPNRSEIDEFEAWAAKIPWMNGPPFHTMFLDLRNRRDSEEKNRSIQKLRMRPGEVLEVLTRRSKNYREEMKQFFSKFVSPPSESLFSCDAGLRSGCVDAYGGFQPCLLLRHPDCVYPLKQGSLENALKHFFPKMRKMRCSDPQYKTRCARCFLKSFCEQCPAKSWMEHGTLDSPVEYFCGVTHEQARHLGLIQESERAWEVKDWRRRIEDFAKKDPVAV